MAGEWIVLSENDLDSNRASGGFYRAYCSYCHHDRRPPSISINEDNGFGYCFRCERQYLVREFNPTAADNIERAQARLAAGDIRVPRPKDLLKPAQAPRQPKPRTISDWQQKEIDLLRAMHERMKACLLAEGPEMSRRGDAYIEERGLALCIALGCGVGYIPDVPLTGKYAPIAKWADHIIIPVYSPTDGLQFAGRCLKYWEPGMDENEHKAILEEKGIERWRKTYAGGWFNFKALESNKHIILVEGAFDALSLIMSGIQGAVAIIGTSVDVGWLPRDLKGVALAFDGDASGREKSARTRDKLYERGYDVTICNPPDDGLGKDWSERDRLHGYEGLEPLLTLADYFWCTVCGKELGNGDVDASYDESGLPYCDHCWGMHGLDEVQHEEKHIA